MRATQIADDLRKLARDAAKIADHSGVEMAQLQLVNRKTELKLGTWRLSATYDLASDVVSFSRQVQEGRQVVLLAHFPAGKA